MQACYTGAVVAVAHLARKSDGWDAYRAVATELGIGAVAGVPMSLGGQVVGALNLYASGVRDWSEQDLAAVQVLADMCTGLLINASQLRQQEQLSEQLQQALHSRVVIEQAKGNRRERPPGERGPGLRPDPPAHPGPQRHPAFGGRGHRATRFARLSRASATASAAQLHDDLTLPGQDLFDIHVIDRPTAGPSRRRPSPGGFLQASQEPDQLVYPHRGEIL